MKAKLSKFKLLQIKLYILLYIYEYNLYTHVFVCIFILHLWEATLFDFLLKINNSTTLDKENLWFFFLNKNLYFFQVN